MKCHPLWIVVALAAIGCEAPELPKTTADASSADGPVDPLATSDAQADATSSDAEQQTDSEPKPFTADSPQAGRRSAAAGGYLGAVGHARFWAEHQAILLNIEHALNLYNATNDGYPESHEEFMNEIIRANSIQLPKLPPGEQYLYDPDEHKLMVERVGGPADTESTK